jgi:hypothetical protein
MLSSECLLNNLTAITASAQKAPIPPTELMIISVIVICLVGGMGALAASHCLY